MNMIKKNTASRLDKVRALLVVGEEDGGSEIVQTVIVLGFAVGLGLRCCCCRQHPNRHHESGNLGDRHVLEDHVRCGVKDARNGAAASWRSSSRCPCCSCSCSQWSIWGALCSCPWRSTTQRMRYARRHRVILRAMSRNHSCARRLSLRRRRSTATICIWTSRFAMASSRIALTSIGSTTRGRMRTTNERRSPDRGRSRSRSCSRRVPHAARRGAVERRRGIRSVRVPRPGSRRGRRNGGRRRVVMRASGEAKWSSS